MDNNVFSLIYLLFQVIFAAFLFYRQHVIRKKMDNLTAGNKWYEEDIKMKGPTNSECVGGVKTVHFILWGVGYTYTTYINTSVRNTVW